MFIHPDRDPYEGPGRSPDRLGTSRDGSDCAILKDSRRMDPGCQLSMATLNRSFW